MPESSSLTRSLATAAASLLSAGGGEDRASTPPLWLPLDSLLLACSLPRSNLFLRLTVWISLETTVSVEGLAGSEEEQSGRLEVGVGGSVLEEAVGIVTGGG